MRFKADHFLTIYKLVFAGLALICACAASDTVSPLACNLKAFQPEQRAEWRKRLEQAMSAVSTIRPLPDGYRFQIDVRKASFREVAGWVELERKCCPYFVFELGMHSSNTLSELWKGTAGSRHSMSMRCRILPFLLVMPLVAADGVNQFAADTYHQLARTRGNLIFSPISISTALSMALAGARGKTAQEMTAVLHAVPEAALLDQLTRSGNAAGDELLLAQALWVERAFPLQPDFIQALQTRFYAPPTPADFAKDPESARAAINQWTDQKTKGKIRELFPPGSLDRATRLVLSSAIYFNGKWQSKFNPKETRPAPFHSQGGATVERPFMNQTARFPYNETATAQVLEMPYAGGALAFDVILPKPGTPLSSLEDALKSDGFSAWLGQLHRREVMVSLPKFRAESSFSLRETLAAMGMPTAFTTAADFSGIAGRRDLAISQVVHKAYIDVSEEGTEAAAATGVGVSVTAFTPPAVFRADRPFLFLIRDTASGAILFAGRFEDGNAR